MVHLHDLARELADRPVEVHDEPETERAVDLGATLVGVNARNLKTSRSTSPPSPARAAAPADIVLVAERHLGPDDVRRHVAEGADAVLVGEALIRDGDPEGAVRAMTGVMA